MPKDLYHCQTALGCAGSLQTMILDCCLKVASPMLDNYAPMSQLSANYRMPNSISSASYSIPVSYGMTSTNTQAVPSQSYNAKRMRLDARQGTQFIPTDASNSALPMGTQPRFQFTTPVPPNTSRVIGVSQRPTFTMPVIPRLPQNAALTPPSTGSQQENVLPQQPVYTVPVIQPASLSTSNIVCAAPFFPPQATVRRQGPLGKPYAHNSARNVNDDSGSSPNAQMLLRADPEIQKEKDLMERNRVRLNSLNPAEKREILGKINAKSPRLIYHVFLPPLPQIEVVPKFCYCGLCRTDWIESNKSKEYCCNRRPCITQSDEFLSLCFNSENIGGSIPLYSYYKAVPNIEFSDSKFRYQAYRSFILYQFGKLGKNVREPPPSRVKSALRYKFLSKDGKYTGFIDVKKKN